MKKTWGLLSLSAGLVLLGALAQPASATFTEFFGENLSPAEGVSGAPVTARNAFLSNLVGVGTENFEGFPGAQAAPINLTFPGSAGGITATLNGGGFILDYPGAGRYATSGTKLWNVDPGGGAFTISFGTPIAAFGFYGTDIGDFGGQITLALAGGATRNVIVNNTVGAPDGSLLFYGFIDTTDTYTSITFGNTSGSDGFGFDDMTVGDQRQIGAVPEPGTLVLFGTGILGLVGLGRKRMKK